MTPKQQYVADKHCDCHTIEDRETCERPCANSRLPQPATSTLCRATLDTRSFSFEAYGENHDAAWGALVQGLSRHGKTHGLADGWFGYAIGDIQVRAVTLGAAYRDREAI